MHHKLKNMYKKNQKKNPNRNPCKTKYIYICILQYRSGQVIEMVWDI